MMGIPDFAIAEDEMRFIVALISFHALLTRSYKTELEVTEEAWDASDTFMREAEKRMSKEEEDNAG